MDIPFFCVALTAHQRRAHERRALSRVRCLQMTVLHIDTDERPGLLHAAETFSEKPGTVPQYCGCRTPQQPGQAWLDLENAERRPPAQLREAAQLLRRGGSGEGPGGNIR